jgi:hypothetical protein
LAYASLGLYFGDDSLFEASFYDRVEAVATGNGMKLTREEIPVGAGPGYAVFFVQGLP